ncbi:MAG: recombinase family protein [Roseiarcus sp.]
MSVPWQREFTPIHSRTVENFPELPEFPTTQPGFGCYRPILKNRFYIGEVAYHGEIHKGEHAPILERELFDAVQAKLAERAARRKIRRSRSPALLSGRIFDDRGNPMSPSHANKKGSHENR